ncbi:hypothetical protein MKW98_004912 [Papaver atlanticum]|uniref:Methenyltetrahydrofolate cyclohydrolase n=1 Tax=Papaver atlanticum TaxID=357466 RepID=A0AAD4SI64_9MAGN|nr:hypothetical protein MKW98_004912 [Papaver atlanticum]
MASTVFSSCSSSTAAARISKFDTTQSGSLRLRQPPAFLSCKPRNPAGFIASISMQRRSCNSSITAVAMPTSTKIPTVKLNRKAVAKQIGDEISIEISRMRDAIGVTPMLAIIQVGDRNHSPVHVANKFKACEAVGIETDIVCLKEDSTEEEVLERISQFNEKSSVHGIHIQLPLPRHMDKAKILNAVRAEKDIDGYNPLNNGVLATRDHEPLFLFPSLIPCAAKGCIELLHRYEICIKGKSVVVIGNGSGSDIVAPAAALLLQREDAGKVTVVHPGTKNLAEIIRQADIVITAAEKAYLVRGCWIKPGAIVIDTGYNIIIDRKSHLGYRFVGDVCYEEACERALAITPVPGGADSMTIAMLLSNALLAAKRVLKFE